MKRKFLIIITVFTLSFALVLSGCGTENNEEKPEEVTGEEEVKVAAEEEQVGEDEGKEEVEEAEEVDSEDPVESESEELPAGPRVEKSYDIEVGQPAPNFTLENLDGEEVSLEDYKGKIVMLNFWATWCKFCVTEMPDMNKLQEENDDLVILAVNVKEEKSKVKDYIDEGGYGFEVVLDYEGKISETYLVSAFPTSYFVDREGILLGGVPGMLEYPQMDQLIKDIREME